MAIHSCKTCRLEIEADGGCNRDDLHSELAAVRAELEKEKRAFVMCSELADSLKGKVEAAEKERDVALASVAVLFAEVKKADCGGGWCHGSKSTPTGHTLGCRLETLLLNLPAATQSHLREVEALRGLEKAARWHVDQFGTNNSGPQSIPAALAALDAAEAERKK